MMWTTAWHPVLGVLRNRAILPAISLKHLAKGSTWAGCGQQLNQGSTWAGCGQRLNQGSTWAGCGQQLNQGSTWAGCGQRLNQGSTWAGCGQRLNQGSTWAGCGQRLNQRTTSTLLSQAQLLQPSLRIVHINARSLHYRPLAVGLRYATRLLSQSEDSWRLCLVRHQSSKRWEHENKSGLLYILAVGVFMLGMSYAGVPMYQMFCQAAGLGGQAKEGHDTSKVESMSARKERVIRVKFTADTASSMQWNFRPEQTEVKVAPGETALAFYKAKNPTDKPIIGISTYNVVPFEAGQYFNKIQCFCFEEQRLNPKEEVDMPVFFFIDPEFADDPRLEATDSITLSYTFFESKHGMTLPLPGYMTTPSLQ